MAYSYDAYGNLTNDGIRTYVYDAENRLISVSDGASTTNYTYSGDGDRVSQTVDGITTSYVIDIAAPLTMVLAETTGTETIYYLHGLDLVAQSDGTSTEYFGYDGLGSVRQMLNGASGVLFAQVFDPYGNLYASAGTDSTSWGFTGEQTDANGLVFLRARYYDPELEGSSPRIRGRGIIPSRCHTINGCILTGTPLIWSIHPGTFPCGANMLLVRHYMKHVSWLTIS